MDVTGRLEDKIDLGDRRGGGQRHLGRSARGESPAPRPSEKITLRNAEELETAEAVQLPARGVERRKPSACRLILKVNGGAGNRRSLAASSKNESTDGAPLVDIQGAIDVLSGVESLTPSIRPLRPVGAWNAVTE